MESLRPSETAVTVAVAGPAVAVAVTFAGVSSVAQTHVSIPTRVAPESPSFGLVSTPGCGIVTASHAAFARVPPSI